MRQLTKWGWAGLLLLPAGLSEAAGLWNLPTTSRQYFGVGYGAGYHAPMVVANPWRGKAASPGVRRVTASAASQELFPSGLLEPSFVHQASEFGASYEAATGESQPDTLRLSYPAGIRLRGFAPPRLRNSQEEQIYLEPIVAPTPEPPPGPQLP